LVYSDDLAMFPPNLVQIGPRVKTDGKSAVNHQ